MAITRRAPRNPRRATTQSLWEVELSKECYWQNELSFNNLKSQSLVRNKNEWKSIYNAFRYKQISSSKHIMKWLRNQNDHFRKSYLHYLFITGYSRESNVTLFNVNVVPNEIQDIILFYVNLIFIKIYDHESGSGDYKPMIRAFDCNFSVNNLRMILGKDKDDSDLRLWTRFDVIKFIYSVQKNGQEICSYHDDEEEDNNNNRWVQVPTRYGEELTLKEIDNKLKYHQVLEFGVDKFEDEHKKQEDDNDNDNHFEWIQSLKIGDDIDVYVCYKWVKGFIFGRDYDTFYIHIENGNSFRVCQDIEIKSIGIDNLQRLQRSDTHCKRNGKSSSTIVEHLIYCAWRTAFNTKSLLAHIPTLFE